MLVMFVFGCGYCLLSPRNPKHVYTIGRQFGRLSRLFGIQLELRQSEASKSVEKGVYIANHQSNWDMVTVSNAIRPGVVTVGKKSLAYIPLFGTIYWLAGNILIDRKNRSKAVDTINQIADKIHASNVSVWLFPEGTRSRGRGLLPFKTGAFHAAITAGVPIVPIVCSSTEHMSVFRGNNGPVIVEVLDPVDTTGYTKANVRELSAHCHQLMSEKFEQLNAEIAARQTVN